MPTSLPCHFVDIHRYQRAISSGMHLLLSVMSFIVLVCKSSNHSYNCIFDHLTPPLIAHALTKQPLTLCVGATHG